MSFIFFKDELTNNDIAKISSWMFSNSKHNLSDSLIKNWEQKWKWVHHVEKGKVYWGLYFPYKEDAIMFKLKFDYAYFEEGEDE